MKDDKTTTDQTQPPPPVTELAQARSRARSVRDWATADDLRLSIEAAGWKVVDYGTDFELEPAQAPDVIADGKTRVGSSGSVPSRRAEPDAAAASLVVIARRDDHRATEAIAALDEGRPEDVQLIIVSDHELTVPQRGAELIRTATTFTAGAALETALRRAIGRIVVVVAPDRVARGDLVGPLTAALDDRDIAIAGCDGLNSSDLRRYHPAAPGPVAALGQACYAFRREDALAREHIDERLFLPASVAAWWSLVLRDAGDGVAPRGALALPLPIDPILTDEPDAPDDVPVGGSTFSREARRDAYRIGRRFARRTELALAGEGLPA